MPKTTKTRFQIHNKQLLKTLPYQAFIGQSPVKVNTYKNIYDQQCSTVPNVGL